MGVLSNVVFREGEDFGRLTALRDFCTGEGDLVTAGSFGKNWSSA